MNTPGLDDMLTPDEMASWFKLTRRELDLKCKGPRPVIPVFKISFKNRRFHPRTILAKLAKDAGIPLEVMAASMGIIEEKKH